MIRPVPFQWPYSLLFWAVFAWAYVPEFGIVRRGGRRQSAADAKSLQVILIGQSIATFAGFWLSRSSPWRISVSHEIVVFFVGLAIFISGSLLRRHCFRMLGSSFTGDVRATADQHVVDRGAYHYLRHPSYTVGLIMNLGLGVALGSWLSALVMVGGSYLAYGYRIAVEERTLLRVIGEPYARFSATRKRLIPFIY